MAPDPPPAGRPPSSRRATPPTRATLGRLRRQVARRVASGLDPIVTITGAPRCGRGRRARHGRAPPRRPGRTPPSRSPTARRFAACAAGSMRRSSRCPCTWQAWNEPNHANQAQSSVAATAGRVTPATTAGMVERVRRAVHRARTAESSSIAGALAPFAVRDGTSGRRPLAFMRAAALRLATGARLRAPRPRASTSGRTTRTRTAARSTTRRQRRRLARRPPEMRGLLNAAVRLGHVASRHRSSFWVTEFAGTRTPPDPHGDAARAPARWVAEALYRMWRNGVDTGDLVPAPRRPARDELLPVGSVLPGREHRPRPAEVHPLRVPLPVRRRPTRQGVLVWGRLPPGSAGRVEIERRTGPTWRPVARITADPYGVFRAVLPTPAAGPLRARLPGGVSSLPFSSRALRRYGSTRSAAAV